jgi:uncharacterized OB-fold protein
MIPQPVGLNAEFYAWCARGELRFQRCTACGEWRHPPRFLCAACGSGDWTWEAASGHGRIFSWTVTHQAFFPDWEVPYAIVVAEMAEGPRLVGNLRGIAIDDLALDLPVHVVLEPVSDTVALTQFGPVPMN